MKSILKATSSIQIFPQRGNIEMPIITRNNSSLPKSIETKAIRKYIHKGHMNAGKFFGVIKVEHLSTANILKATLIRKLFSIYSSLHLEKSTFRINATVLAGALHRLLEHNDQQNLAIRISTKLQLFIP